MKHVARKRFGQHFLTDVGLIEAIADAIDPRPGQALVEIGPGLGALTRPVLQRCGRLTVIELDRDLAAGLRAWPGLQVIEADVLGVDWQAVRVQACGHAGAPPDAPLRVVGNLPYNISTPILFHLLGAAAQVQDQHFMLQSEVVDRMVAGPGRKAYGRLSVMLQWRYAMERVLDVPPQAFEPAPAVDSAVVRMQPLPTPAWADAALLSELVTVAFSQRRKLLRHTLGRWLDHKAFTGTFDTQRRAEEVPVNEYVELARTLGG
ncbi:MAG: 16S rRNA (adenine(1518)-N(6)/adenine(1519)-N(6))-dimethyltransferase RsmA [Rubrivivax sp.]|jgi:16S rRNA (adenine1518-N6/adenine1519-N6)-dimethyltransferase